MTETERARFDDLLEEAISALPQGLRALLDVTPVIVEDYPSEQVLREMGVERRDELCGLHSGIALTERSVEHSGTLPEDIHLYREGILALAGGWVNDGVEDPVYEEIWVTLLHEMGHHFGLNEDDLAELGYD
ncbi:MAG: metallopeptidase family protein [Phycisphaerales bacterium]